MRGRERMIRAVVSTLQAAANSGVVSRWSVKYGIGTARLQSHLTFRVQIEKDEVDGGYIAECLDLPGCVSDGETEEEAVQNLVEAIVGVLEVRMQRQLPAIKPRPLPDNDHSHRKALEISLT